VTADTAIACHELEVSYGQAIAVRDATFTVPHGSVFGLLGPNGAGKTSVIRVLTTLMRPAGGRVRVLGLDPVRASSAVRRLIGYVPQVLSADQWLSGRENLRLFADLHHVPWRRRNQRVDELLELMGLASVGDDLLTTYSGGMIRRLEIATALLGAPNLLLLDEPTVGLDPIARRAVWGRLKQIRAEHATTILATTHYLEEAEEHCDLVAVMGDGVVLATGEPQALTARADGGVGRLEDVFVALTGDASEHRGGLRDVARVRRTARRLR
jgi:ABC-2 type transport system ATP-binding protein